MANKVKAARTADEVREVLTDRAALKNLLSDPDDFVAWTEDSINLRLKSDPGILDQNKEQFETFMADWIRNGQDPNDPLTRRLSMMDPNQRSAVRPGRLYNKNAIGAKHDSSFEKLSDLVYAASTKGYVDDRDAKALQVLKNDLSSVKPSDGGFLIPEIQRAELLRTAMETATVRPRARVIPMDSLTVSFPVVDSTSNVSSVYGGVVGYWVEEGASLTESQPRFGKIELRANKLCLYTEVPSELLQDSRPALDAFIGEIFPEAITWFEDVAFFVGGGVGEPLGFLNAAATVSVTRSTATAGDNVEWVDIANMYSRMLPQSLNRAVWVISPEVLPSLLTMTLPGNISPIMISPSGGSGAPNMSMLGAQIVVSEKARQIGDAGDINLVDFGFYLLGDRQAMSMRESEHIGFDRDKIAFRFIERLDGRPWLLSAITPQNGGDTLSAFVNLTAAP